ncbi:MAG: nucleoside deaminase [Balneolaceae bacterium]|nr:nucleoside deaminase [Balneolaceae bacterium]
MISPHSPHMQAAIDIAEKKKTPFGAAIALGDQLLVAAANETSEQVDPTAHAELLAIRRACELLGKTDLSGHTLYATCEPCSMCMSAAIWANLDAVFYGVSIPEIKKRINQISISSSEVAKQSFYPIEIKGDVLLSENLKLLKRYS